MKRRGRTSGSSPKKLPTKSTRTPRTTQAKRSSSLSSEELQRQIADLTHELKEARDQQAATANVLRIISGSTFDLQSVLDTLVEAAARLCEADHAWLFRRDGQILHWVASFGYGSEAHNRLRDFFKTKVVLVEQGSVTGRAVLEGKAVQVPDVLADPEYTYGDAQKVGGYRAALGVPLLSAGEVVGVIFVSKVVPEPFREKQIALVTTFADQAVIAIENTRLLKELRQRTDDLTESLHQQTATADVLKVISRSTFDLEVVLNTLSESAARLCDGHISWIFRRDGEVLRWAASYGHTPEAHTRIRDYFRPLVVPIDRSSVVGRAASEAAVVHLSDVLTDPEYRWQNAQKIGGYRAALGAPLVREGRVVGALFVAKTTTKPFTEKQIELVTTFADQAAIAIENVRLFESVEARTRELAKSLEDLRTAQDRLVQTEKLASLGQLTAGIAHEIKNPLNFVNNFSAVSVELIDELREALAGAHLDNKLRAEINEIADMLQGNLDKVVQHGKRADSIVKNMLLHSRQGSGEHRPVDINASGRGEPQSRLSRGAGREAGLQYHVGKVLRPGCR